MPATAKIRDPTKDMKSSIFGIAIEQITRKQK